jgi:predicted DNA-binding WGR domain protein
MPDDLPACVCLASIDASQNRYRLYRLMWQPTLWGEGALVRWWGRKGSTGRNQVNFYSNPDDARAEFQRLLKLRTRHGYRALGHSQEPHGNHLGCRTPAFRTYPLAGGWQHDARVLSSSAPASAGSGP